MNAAEIRSDWVGHLVDGRYALLEWLGGSPDSGVFLTELHEPRPQKAAIKLIPATQSQADRHTADWSAITSLSHPHLIKIITTGRTRMEGIELAYVVTEYAEEVLAQIIPERPLTTEETREMLDPVIDTLSYLHAKGFVHGHLKTSNILVVDNQLKLSTDTLLVSGAIGRQEPRPRSHDVPLNSSATITPAADLWILGMTIVEVLTQHPLAWDRSSGQPPTIPETLPEPFFEIARRCLQLDPARRCTLADVKALLGGTIGAYHEPAQHHSQIHVAQRHNEKEPSRFPVVPMIVTFVVLLAIIAALVLRPNKQRSSLPAEQSRQSPPITSPPPSQSPAGETPKGTVEKGAAASRLLPDVPQRASDTIQGTVQTAIRVHVNAAGEVSEATVASPGPSKYFARLALESAHSWKFKPAQADGRPVPSIWILKYRFRNTGTDVTPVEEKP